MKNDFEIRPMYVRDNQSINGHVLLCILSLIMVRIIQRKFAEEGYSVTVGQLQECLQSLKLMILSSDGNHCIYMRSMEAEKRDCLRKSRKENELGEMLMNILGCSLQAPMNTVEQLRKTFKIKSLGTSKYQQELMCKYCSNIPTKNEIQK